MMLWYCNLGGPGHLKLRVYRGNWLELHRFMVCTLEGETSRQGMMHSALTAMDNSVLLKFWRLKLKSLSITCGVPGMSVWA